MNLADDFEKLKKAYIFKTMSHLHALKEISVEEMKDPKIKAEFALRQVESSTTFMDLCVFILSLKHDS